MLGRKPTPDAPRFVAGSETPPAQGHDGGGAPPSGPRLRGPLESLLLHPALVLVPVVLCVGAAIAIGLLRTPQYTSEARVSVGRADVPAYTLQGVIIGNATLAGSYARAVEAPSVITSGARAAGITTAEARERLTASPVPNSTLIRIEGRASANRTSRRLANGAAAGLIRYVEELNVEQQDNGMIERYRSAQRETDRQRRRVRRIQRTEGRNSLAAERARLDLLSAQLRSQTLSTRVVQNAEQPAQNLLQLVVPATNAESDRMSVLGRLVLVALAAGILLGLALALLRSNGELIRHSRESLAARRR